MVNTLVKRFNQGVYKAAYPHLWNAGGMIGRYMARNYRGRKRGGLRGARSVTGRARYSGYRSNAGAGLNRIVSRKRRRTRGRRRKLRFGTKVRKQALGLYEGKRYGLVASDLAVPVNTVKRYRPMLQMVTDSAPTAGAGLGTDTINTKLRQGMKIFVRGIRIKMHIVNKSTDRPVDVRIICGWRKKFTRGSQFDVTEFNIFRQRSSTVDGVDLATTTEATNMPMSTMDAPLATSKYFYCAKDMVVRLGYGGGVGSDDNGSHFKLVNIWWELNNKINKLETQDLLPASGDAEKIMDWFPVVYFYHTDPSSTTPTAAVDYTLHSTVYWKDPLG